MDAVVIAEKVCHKGQMFGAVSNGGAVMNLSNGIAIKFIALNDQFVTIQVLNSGIGKPIKNQTWIKGTTTKTKKKQQPKQEQLIVNDKVETENAW